MAAESVSTPVTKADPTPATCDEKSLSHHRHRAKVLIRKAYSPERWRDSSPAKSSERRAWKQHTRCIRHAKTRREIRAYRKRVVAEFREHRRSRQSDCIPGVTIYHGLGGCWAIPVYVVACESGGSWSAYNPSGARGPYQFLGWDVPWPVRSVEDKKAHHRFAAKLWNGGAGAGNWVCA